MEERKESVKYRIAEFAKMVGVEPSTVRYYEKHGLPGHQRDENGYRTFSEFDAFRMNTFRSIYARGFSIKEAVQMLENPSRKDLLLGLRKNCTDMERELLLLAERKRWAEETIRILELREAGEPMLWHMELPDFYYLPASVKGDFSITQENGDVRDFWEEYLGYTRFVGIADGARFVGGERAYIDCGEAVRAEDFTGFGFPTDGTVRRLEMGDYLCFYDAGVHPDHVSLADHPAVEEYLRAHGLEAAGEMLLFYLMLYIQDEGSSGGVMALPVRPKGEK